jgi:hypothetical protein
MQQCMNDITFRNNYVTIISLIVSTLQVMSKKEYNINVFNQLTNRNLIKD